MGPPQPMFSQHLHHIKTQDLYFYLILRLRSHSPKCDRGAGAVPVNLRKYFVTLNHESLMNLLRKNIHDKRGIELVKRDLKAGVMETGCRRKQRKAFRREDGIRSLCWFALRLPRTLSTAALQFSLCCLQRRASVFFQRREQLILKMGVKKPQKLSAAVAI